MAGGGGGALPFHLFDAGDAFPGACVAGGAVVFPNAGLRIREDMQLLVSLFHNKKVEVHVVVQDFTELAPERGDGELVCETVAALIPFHVQDAARSSFVKAVQDGSVHAVQAIRHFLSKERVQKGD